MHKFFVSPSDIIDETAIISGEDVKHIYKVLRLKEEDKIIVNNSEGIEYLGEIDSISKSEVRVNLLEKSDINNESPLEITLFQGLPKSSKMDYIVQKGTELGIKQIVPIITSRVVVKNEIGEFKKTDRWKRIALEACKQCKRTFIPIVDMPIEFDSLLESLRNYDLVIVPYENAEGFGIKKVVEGLEKVISKVAVVIGPEGGFEEFEIEKLKENNAFIVTLGPRIFRTETAGIISAAILQYELGDLGGMV